MMIIMMMMMLSVLGLAICHIDSVFVWQGRLNVMQKNNDWLGVVVIYS